MTAPLLALVSAVLFSYPLTLSAADIQPSAKFEVHEWGTFTSVAGENGMALEWLPFGGPTDLPCFVHRLEVGAKATLGGTVRMETPVIYFYARAPMTARVHVDFPQGFITEWYPRANQLATYMGSGMGPQNPDTRAAREGETDWIEWRDVKIDPAASPKFPFQFESSHYYTARGTDAAPLAVWNETEKFLFYRGVGQFQPPISAQVSGDRVIVRNLAKDDLSGVILFENHDGRIRYQIQGSVSKQATLHLPATAGDLSALKLDLEKFLATQGLFPKEAHAMVETWRDSWFEEGTRVFYILPRSSVDEILPLSVEPSPNRSARVFVGRAEVFTAETSKIIRTAIDRQDRATLEEYGRFLQPFLGDVAPANRTVAEIRDKYFFAASACGKGW